MPRVGRADVVVGVVAAALFCLVAVAVVTGWPPLAEIDRAGAAWGERNGGAQSWWVPVWTTVSAVFGPLAFRIAAVVALVWMLVRRRRGASRAEASTLFFASATVLLGGIVPVAVILNQICQASGGGPARLFFLLSQRFFAWKARSAEQGRRWECNPEGGGGEVVGAM